MKNAKPMPPMTVLQEMFTLDATRGVLLRNKSVTSYKAGSVAGTPTRDGHLITGVGKERYLVHRIVYFMAHGVDPVGMLVDHINGDPSDNRPCNLRLATVQQNGRSRHRNRSDNVSGESNVSWNARWNRWQVSIGVGGKRVQRRFRDKHEAVACARQLRKELFGEFAGSVL